MAHPPEVRAAVRAGYVHDMLPLERAASRVGVRYQTARNWKRKDKLAGDDWDKARAARRMAAGPLAETTTYIVEDFITLFRATTEELRTATGIDPIERARTMASLSDAFVKFMRAAGGADRGLGELSVAMKVLEALAQFVRDRHGDDTEWMERFAVLLEEFGPQVSAMFSGGRDGR